MREYKGLGNELERSLIERLVKAELMEKTQMHLLRMSLKSWTIVL
jgi:hypothetical protein